MNKPKISIIGCGVVGTTIGQGFRQHGHEIIFYDIDESKIREFERKGLKATLCIHEAVGASQVSFVCVPAPSRWGKIDLSYVQSAIEGLGKALAKKHSYHLVVVKSTVTPTTTENLVIPLLEKHSKKSIGADIGVCFNPEFLTEINKSWTSDEHFSRGFFNEPVIVIGSFDRKSGDFLQTIYDVLDRPIVRTNLRTAEMIKYAFNCALATKISYWNEIFCICNLLDIDSTIVAGTAGLDQRIGKYGTVHGKAFGGSCLPKDLRAIIEFSGEQGYDPKLLKAVEEVNERIKAAKGVRE